jgi:ribosomal protein S18 acetylase RimI-like enzyme
MEIVVNNPSPGDIGWLISIHGKLYAEQFNFDSNFEIAIAKKVLTFLEAPHAFNRLWIASTDYKRVGSIAVSLQHDQTAFVNFLLVKTQYRGYGIARKLLDKVISHSKDNDLEILRLETYSCLESARKLYSKYGFEIYKKNAAVQKYGRTFDQEFWKKTL